MKRGQGKGVIKAQSYAVQYNSGSNITNGRYRKILKDSKFGLRQNIQYVV
jgi:hypothetical protein